jgi:hypothetical protein
MTLAFSVLYFLSDVIEVMQGFSDGPLWLTFIAEADVPIFVVGIARTHTVFWPPGTAQRMGLRVQLRRVHRDGSVRPLESARRTSRPLAVTSDQ